MVWPQTDRGSIRDLYFKAHHCLVDRAYLFHIQRTVGEAVAVQKQQAFEDSENYAIGNAWRCDRRCRIPLGSQRSAFQEWVDVGIEQASMPRRQTHCTVSATVVNQAAEREELRPSPKPL